MKKKFMRYMLLTSCAIFMTACGTKQEEPQQSITLMASQLNQTTEKKVWECGYRDLTHDGIVDKLTFEISANSGNTDVESLLRASEVGYICVYRGLDEVGNYEEQPLWTSQDVAWARPGNAQISAVEKNGNQYLLISEIAEQQGEANYSYRVFSLDEQGQEVIMDSYEEAFSIAEEEVTQADKEERNATVPTLREKISIWFENAVLLVATDINTEQVIFVSDFENGGYVSPEYYYQHVWARMSETVSDTIFETKYFRFDVPEEWLGKYTFTEEENGKNITFYHKASVDKGAEGIFGYIWLCTDEEAIDVQEYAGAYYVAEPIETEEGTMMCVALQPHDVQYADDVFEEYNLLSETFATQKIAQHIKVKGNPNEESIFSVISEIKAKMGIQGVAVPGQTLLGYLNESAEMEQRIFYDCELQNEYKVVPTLIIDGKDYSNELLSEDAWFSEGAANEVLYLNWFGVIDIDTEDGVRELAISDQGVSGDPVVHLYQYDGEHVTFVGDMGILESTESFQVNGDGTVTASIRVWYPENNAVQGTYCLENGKLTQMPQERYELFYQNSHAVLETFFVYTERDKKSEQIELKAGVDSVTFLAFYSDKWVELVNSEGKIYYLYLDREQLEDGRYIDQVVADIYRAG